LLSFPGATCALRPAGVEQYNYEQPIINSVK